MKRINSWVFVVALLLSCSEPPTNETQTQPERAVEDAQQLAELGAVVDWLKVYYSEHPPEHFRVTVEIWGKRAVVRAEETSPPPTRGLSELVAGVVCPHLDEEVWRLPNSGVGVNFSQREPHLVYDCRLHVNQLPTLSVKKETNLLGGPGAQYSVTGRASAGELRRYVWADNDWVRLYAREKKWIRRDRVEIGMGAGHSLLAEVEPSRASQSVYNQDLRRARTSQNLTKADIAWHAVNTYGWDCEEVLDREAVHGEYFRVTCANGTKLRVYPRPGKHPRITNESGGYK